jgi:adenylate cyclase
MKKDLQRRTNFYKKKFNVIPSFKAGIYLGDVTTGEIGALKKEIFFTGDVLNATARIQGMCNHYHAELLVSGELVRQLQLKNGVIAKSLGTSILKGRAKPMELFALEERRAAMSARLF